HLRSALEVGTVVVRPNCIHFPPLIRLEEREALRPCSGWRRPMPPLDCCHSDAQSDMAHTSPTNCAWRAFSRIHHGVVLSRAGSWRELRRRWLLLALIPIRGQEGAP